MNDPLALHYDTHFMARFRELECACQNGMTLDEVYAAEADLALREMGPIDGGAILDVACGFGRHTFAMSDRLEHRVAIRGIDIAPALIAEANAEYQARRGAGIRDDLQFSVADMLDVGPDSFAPWTRFRAITCLGDSFGYQSNAKTRRIFQRFFDLLEPSGQLILQFRTRFDPPTAEIHKRSGFSIERRVIDGVAWEVYGDPSRGDATYEYDVDCPHPDPGAAEMYTEQCENGFRTYRDQDGWEYSAYGRCYLDPQGGEHHLPPTWMVKSFFADGPFMATRRILEEIGFRSVERAEGRPLGARRNVAIVATHRE